MKIFVSYAHANTALVLERIINPLTTARHTVWYDKFLVPGDNWRQVLEEEIETCDVFIYAMTPNSVKSEWCTWELNLAVTKDKKIIPVILKRVKVKEAYVSKIIDNIQYADLSSSKGYWEKLNGLLKGIEKPVNIPKKGVQKLHIPQSEHPAIREGKKWIIIGVVAVILLGVFVIILLLKKDQECREGSCPTLTPIPTYTLTSTLTNTPEPSSIFTHTNTPTQQPTDTDQSTATDTPQPTFTYTATTPPTLIHTVPPPPPTLTHTPTPTLTETPIDPREQALLAAQNFSAISNAAWSPFQDNIEGYEMVLVPINGEIPAFWLDRFEITVEQHQACVNTGSCPPLGNANVSANPQLPSTNITWNEAERFCRSRGGSLPSAAQWRFAFGGVENWSYPQNRPFTVGTLLLTGGSTADDVSWVGGADLAGNAQEWTASSYGGDIYRKTVMGASFSQTNRDPTVSTGDYDDVRRPDLGFRCVILIN